MPRYVEAEKAREFLLEESAHQLKNDNIVKAQDLKYAADCLDGVPSADAAPVIHAHWIHTGEYLTNSDGKRLKKLSDLYVCHRCHRVKEIPEPYCNCGAKMDEEMEEDA